MQVYGAVISILLVATAVTGCEARGDPDLASAATGNGVTRAERVSPTTDSTVAPPGQVESRPDGPAESSSAAPPIATVAELAELSAALNVPVAGVSRSELRDSYADARGDRVHEALDIMAPRGTPVLSAADGRLLRMFDSEAGGLMVYATDASERFILLYGHLDRYADGLSDGMPLVRGQVIGYVGTTGNAPTDTPHLHFGILRGQPDVSWSDGVAVNPYPLLINPPPHP